MKYNDVTNKQGLVQDVDFLVDTNDTISPIADKTRNFNLALNEFIGIVLSCDGTWQFDDTNYTDLPIGTTDVVANQADYSFNDEMLTINAVEVKGTNGKWVRLLPVDLYRQNSEGRDGVSNFMETAGMPEYYDKVGDSIFLYPKTNYSQASSLKVFFQRKVNEILAADTTLSIGIASHLHRFLSICVAYDWAVAKSHAKLNFLLAEKNRYIQLIKDYYSVRTKDEVRRLTPYYQNNK
jgi:hypothetical protein